MFSVYPSERRVSIDRCSNGYVVTFQRPRKDEQSRSATDIERCNVERHVCTSLQDVVEFVLKAMD
ncbi:MAG: hypothetical protein L0Z53_04460 [Acidobacteriales bacterium]|nr:hypothetical protein [Terriglobales bacterium]